ncbi:MAG: hypothetical protein Q9163_001700 [Psora crenata]
MLPQALSNLFKRRHNTDESQGSRERPHGLREELEDWQIFFIAVSTVIGVTIFYSDGKTLQVAGPGGTLLAFALVGVVAICVMECVSELIQMFPTPNAMVEFIRIFVDEDLAWIIGIGYWYTWAAIFPTQIIAAANFTRYWHLAQVFQTVALYIIAPLVMLFINYAGVFTFGWIETIAGTLKIIIVIAGGIVIFVVPIIAYGFLGVETMTVTAYEAKDLRSIRRPSQIIAYFILALYFFCAIGELLNVGWTNGALPKKYLNPNLVTRGNDGQIGSGAIIVVAAFQSGHKKLAGLLNGCIIFSALSAANSSLYIASRILYGMTREIDSRSPIAILKGLSSVWNKTGVPVRALWVSFIAFIWLPFLQLKGGVAISDVRTPQSTR